MAASPDIRILLLFLVIFIVSYGTRYSIINSTFLDTSNPYITTSHHLTGAHFFATKKNPLNKYFLKYAWGWTTAAFVPLLATSPSPLRTRRALQYLAATFSWLAFTTWFFGPAIIERLIDLTGGICVVHVDNSFFVPVPVEYCYRRELVSHNTHPELFPAPLVNLNLAPSMPRMRRGHDISGHIFLLTLSVMFLGDQIRQSLMLKRVWNGVHGYAVFGAGALSALWLLSLGITSIYFHTAFEKYTGLAVGLITFAASQLPVWLSEEPIMAKTARSRSAPRRKKAF